MEKNVRKRGLALLLCLVMVASLLPVMGASAVDEPTVVSSGTQVNGDANDLKLEKKLLDNHDGTYSIELDGYANAEIVDEPITEKIPTDFVIVVDQSGSMDTRDMPTGDPTVQNNKYLEDVANGAYYVKDGDNYYRVYGVKDYLFRYYPANYWYVGDLVTRFGTNLGWFMSNTDADTTFENQMYFREVVDGTTYYQPITMSVSGKIGTYYIKFRFDSKMTGSTYWFDREVQTYNGNVDSPWYHNMTNIGDKLIKPGWSVGLGWPNYGTIDGAVQGLWGDDNAYTYSEVSILGWRAIHTGMFVNYPMYDRHVGYTKLCYRDVNGVEHEVQSDYNNQSVWEFCNDDSQALNGQTGSRPTYSGLYTFPGTGRRIDALQAALTEFAQTVAGETDSFGAVDNRVSIIGFSSDADTYANTELLTGSTFSIRTGSRIPDGYGYSADGYNHNGKLQSEATAADYAGALVSASGDAGSVNTKITDAIDAVTAYGGTQPEDGLSMAYQVLSNRGEGDGKTTYTIRSGAREGETVDRNTVVIFFTDGQPGNYRYSNQYTEANEVVEQAKRIKDYKDTTVFTIGVFGESDGNPLTYDETNLKAPYTDRAYWPYMGGWMESYQQENYPYTWHCLRRQWRPNNAEGYTEKPNDTIYDYMSVVSSNYPDAKDFIAPAWLTGSFSGNYIAATDGDQVRVKSTAEATNKYYRMASNQDTLVAAFLQAVTMNNSETIIDSNTTLDETGVLTDTVNTADFTVTPGSTVTVQVVDRTTGEVDDEATAALVYEPSVGSDGTVTVTGFDYSGTYNSKKLVVTITGLTPKRLGTLHSNVGNAAITDGDDEVQAETSSPQLTLGGNADNVKVLDFNMIANIESDVANVTERTNNGGTFNWAAAGDDLTFTPNIVTTGAAWNTSAFSGVNTALYYKNHVWTKAVVVPAASVYVADELKTLDSDFDDGVSGYDAALAETVAPEITGQNSGSRTITFYGTAIDIYATTDDESGWITATIYAGDTVPENNAHENDSGTVVNTELNGLKSVIVKNNSVKDHYGCPTVRFVMDEPNTYTVQVNTSAGSNYKFEGVRVYRPANDDAQAYQPASESADFTRVRDILLAAETFNSAAVDGKTVSGAIFVEVKGTDNDPEETVTADAATYRDNGPRGEVYLQPNQAIAFKVDTTGPVLIGMSSADGTAVDYAVTNVTEAERISTGTISSTVDMYYEAQPDANGYICIKNVSGGLLAVTNVRAASSGAASFSVGEDVLEYVLQFEQMLKGADSAGLKPVWNDDASETVTILKALFQLLLQSLSSLFSGLGQW